MINEQNHKRYDLEERTLLYAKKVREFVKKLPKTITNYQYISQLVRSSSSIGANYIEANESLSKKDFIMRVKISRKEAKETEYWLHLIDCDKKYNVEKDFLIKETRELRKIFAAIVVNSL